MLKNGFKFIVFTFLILIGNSCSEPIETVSEYPEITFKEFKLKELKLVFEFIDGDGDLGIPPDYVEPPFNPESQFYFNLYLEVFEGGSGENWERYNPDIPIGYRFEYLEQPTGNNKTLKGTFELETYNFLNGAQFTGDSIYIRFYIIDRDLHFSNTDSTYNLAVADITKALNP